MLLPANELTLPPSAEGIPGAVRSTWLPVSVRPPSGSGEPPSRIRIWPLTSPPSRRLSSMIAPPEAVDCTTVPDRLAVNARSSRPGLRDGRVSARAVLVGCRAITNVRAPLGGGVPARRAQPFCSGPITANAAIPAGAAIASIVVPVRSAGTGLALRLILISTAATTAATQMTVSTSIHHDLTSVPVPRPCSTATGQLTYASQWIARHERYPR